MNSGTDDARGNDVQSAGADVDYALALGDWETGYGVMN